MKNKVEPKWNVKKKQTGHPTLEKTV